MILSLAAIAWPTIQEMQYVCCAIVAPTKSPWKKMLRQHVFKTGLKMTTPIVVRVCHIQKLVGK